MTKWTNFITQLIGFGAQVVVPTFVTNPGSMAKYAAGIAVVQGVAAMFAHYSNPDGSPASQPYQPAK